MCNASFVIEQRAYLSCQLRLLLYIYLRVKSFQLLLLFSILRRELYAFFILLAFFSEAFVSSFILIEVSFLVFILIVSFNLFTNGSKLDVPATTHHAFGFGIFPRAPKTLPNVV